MRPSRLHCLQRVEGEAGRELLPVLCLFLHLAHVASCRAWAGNTIGKAKHPQQREPLPPRPPEAGGSGGASRGFPFPSSAELPTQTARCRVRCRLCGPALSWRTCEDTQGQGEGLLFLTLAAVPSYLCFLFFPPRAPCVGAANPDTGLRYLTATSPFRSSDSSVPALPPVNWEPLRIKYLLLHHPSSHASPGSGVWF